MTAMVPAIKNFVIPMGTDWERSIIIKQRVDGDLEPVDLTGYEARMQIRAKYSGALLCDLTVENGRISIDETEGRITMSIPNTVTSAILTAGLPIKTVVEYRDAHGREVKGTGPAAVYDMELIDASGNVQRPIQGEACLTMEATR